MKQVMAIYRLGEMSGGFGETTMTSSSLGELSGGFGQTSYDQL